ncbi:MAG: PEP-CTERM sorting domain-containing protein [Pirellulales bacterium]|nr:PEP-CTERM sorting domain-containing protein [Pirellulales bacterium]
MRHAAIAVAVLLGLVTGPAFGEIIIYGPVTFEEGDQGGPYYKYGPDSGDVTLSFPGDPGEKTLRVDPTVNGSGLVHDTGFTTTLSSYTVSADCEWDANSRSRFSLLGYAIPGLGSIGIYPYKSSSMVPYYYASLFDETNPLNNANPEHVEDWTSGSLAQVPFFKASDQASGDSVTDLLPADPHTITMEINDTGDNATSTFQYTWTRVVGEYTNTWIVEQSFAAIRDAALGEATSKDPGDGTLIVHVGDLFDTLVSTARNNSENTGFVYFSFANGEGANWDNTTVTAVPEPSTVALILSGVALCLAAIRRRRIS